MCARNLKSDGPDLRPYKPDRGPGPGEGPGTPAGGPVAAPPDWKENTN